MVTIEKNSVILFKAPSNAGKTFFCKNQLLPFLKENTKKFHYISTDDLRREILGEDLHKHDPRMNEVSPQTFERLEFLLDQYISYPINSEVVVLDFTNLHEPFEDKLIAKIKEANYKVILFCFDYDNFEDYLKFSDEKTSRAVIVEHINIAKDSFKKINKKKYNTFYKIKEIGEKINLAFERTDENLLLDIDKFFLIGDIHGCYEEMLSLMAMNKSFMIKNERLLPTNDNPTPYILIGDICDKGPKIKEVIEFVYNNKEYIHTIVGNHEYWVYQYLTGKLKKSEENDKLIQKFFDTVLILEIDEVLRKKFNYIVENSFHSIETPFAIITHAPVSTKFVRKDDKISLKHQRNIRTPKIDEFESESDFIEARSKDLEFLLNETSYKKMFFGHIMIPRVFHKNNKIGIDTGCVSGGELTGVLMEKKEIKIFSVKSKQPKKPGISHLFLIKEEADFENLDNSVKAQIRFASIDKMNFLSGTMSPPPASFTKLESLEEAILFYEKAGVDKVVLQPKHMGSRCNLLLHKDEIEKCKAFTRNGYLIKNEWIKNEKSLGELFKELQLRLAHLFAENVEYIFFDGELLPWNSLGMGLIENEFLAFYEAVNYENEFLENHLGLSFDDIIRTKKVPEAFKNEFENFLNNHEGYELTKSNIEKFKKQVDIFAATYPLDFKPFAILKTISFSGDEEVFIGSKYKNSDFDFGQPNLILNLETKEFEVKNVDRNFNSVEEFWEFITVENQMEGIVVKPEKTYIEGIPPYLKVRNEEYLRMVYGFNYLSPNSYKRCLKEKSVKKKIRASIEDWELGIKLLKIPMKEISIQNKKYVYLLNKMIESNSEKINIDKKL